MTYTVSSGTLNPTQLNSTMLNFHYTQLYGCAASQCRLLNSLNCQKQEINYGRQGLYVLILVFLLTLWWSRSCYCFLQNGLLSSLPHALSYVGAVASGQLADLLRRRTIFSTTVTRKLFQCICTSLVLICIVIQRTILSFPVYNYNNNFQCIITDFWLFLFFFCSAVFFLVLISFIF